MAEPGHGAGGSAADHLEVRPTANRFDSATIERLMVYGLAALLAAGLLFYVARYGRDVPYSDDWESVPVWSGNESLTSSWLWSQHNEHRMPVARLVTFAVLRATGDLRAVMLLTNLVLGAVTLGCLRTVRRIRGRVTVTDALVPLLLLGWSMYENTIFTIQLFFVAAPSLVIAILLLSVGPWRAGPWRSTALGAALVLLPLNGALGLNLAPAMVAYVAFLARSRLRDGDTGSRRDAAVLLCSCLLATALGIAYLVGFRSSALGEERTILDVVRTVSETLAISFGPLGARLWPASALATVVVVAFGAVPAARALRRPTREDDKERALAVLATLTALGLLILVIGFGRTHFGPGAGFSNRYTIFPACLLVASYVSITLFLRGRLGRLARVLLLTGAAAGFVAGIPVAVAYGTERAAAADALTSAIDDGARTEIAAAIARDRLHPDGAKLQRLLGLLYDRREGVYESYPEADRPLAFREIDRPLQLSDVVSCRSERAFVCRGNDPQLIYSLPSPAPVWAVHLRYRLEAPQGSNVALQVFWSTGDAGFREERSHTFRVTPSAEAQEVKVWINEPVDRLRIDPARRDCVFEFLDATLLAREDSS